MTYEHTTLIEAPAHIVWTATTDIERWPEWLPTIQSVIHLDGGPIGLGSRAQVKQPLQPVALWTVVAFEPDRRFVWTSVRSGLRLTATHEVTPHGDGALNLLRIEAAGPLALVLRPVFGSLLRRVLATENRCLKAHCEAAAPSCAQATLGSAA